MSARILLFACLVGLTVERPANALRCYNCMNLKTDSSLLTSEIDPSCEHVDSTTVTETCGDTTDKCAYLDLKVTGSVPLLGDTSATLQYRGCVNALGLSNGCHKASTSDLFGRVKTVFSKLPHDITGIACYCDSDLCDPNCDGVIIAENCVQVWVIVVVVLVCIAGLVGICALCRCCKRSSNGAIIRPGASMFAQPQAVQPMQATQVTISTAVPAGIANPGYAT